MAIQEIKTDLSVDGVTTLGQIAQLTEGKGLLNLTGAQAISDRSLGPDIVFKVDGIDQPIRQIMNFQFNNQSELVGCYYNGAYRAGNAGSGWRNWYNGTNHRQEYKVFQGETAGANINGSFTDSYHVDLSTGNVDFKQDVTVTGDLNATLATAAQPNITSLGTLTSLDVDNININSSTISAASVINFDIDSNNNSDGDYFAWTTDGGITELARLVDEGQLSVTSNVAGDALTLLTDNDTKNNSIAIGRSAVEANIAIPSAYGQYLTDAAAGDLVLRSTQNFNRVMMGVGSNAATLSVLGGKVGVNEPSPYNALDVSGGAVIGSGYSGVETAPSNGLLVEGKLGINHTTPTNTLDVAGGIAIGTGPVNANETAPNQGMVIDGNIDFYSSGMHRIRFPDPDSGGIGRSGIQQYGDEDKRLMIWNNSSEQDIDIYNNGAWLYHRGWNGSYSTYAFKSKSDTGDNIIGANTVAVEDEEMVANKTGSGRDFGSVNFYLDETNNKLKFKVRYTNETGVNITNITQANPAVVTANSHGYSNGDKVEILQVGGMTELNQNIYTVANSTTNTFELSGEDSTSYTAYTSGGTVNKTRFKTGEITLT